jgi:hypothetical protein
MASNGIGERFQQGGPLPDPISQRGTVKIKAFAVEDLALAVKRQVVGIFADQNVRQEARPWTQPSKDQIGVHVISPGNLAHRHTTDARLQADHPLLVVRPNPTLPPLRHTQPR